MLDYRYQTFMVLCDKKNYTQTAKALFITQPAVSQHIQWLEKKHGVCLFQYRHRKLSLTEKGKELYRYVSELQANIVKIEHELVRDSSKKQQVRFATTLSIQEYLLPQLIEEMLLQEQAVDVSCAVENTERILRLLTQGKIDFALIEGNFPKEFFSYIELGQQPLVMVAAQESVLDARKTYLLSELLTENFITREKGSGTRKLVDMVLSEQNFEVADFAQCVTVNHFHTIKYLLKENRGISFLYEAAVKDELRQKQLKKIKVRHVHSAHQFAFVYLKDSLFEAELKQMAKQVQNLLQYIEKKETTS